MTKTIEQLITAIKKNDLDTIRTILMIDISILGKQIDLSPTLWVRPLHLAMALHKPDVVKLMREMDTGNFYSNFPDKLGWTPEQFASLVKYKEE